MKILIADDHELFLNGLEFILGSEFKDSEIVTAKNYTEIFEKLKVHNNIDLIITDLAMPGANWLEALGKMHNQAKDTPIIIISAVFDKDILQKTLEIGVSGYIPKELFSNKAGNKDLEQEIKRLKILSSDNALIKAEKKLTPRQIDVVKAIARGLSNKIIAYELGLTEGTVKVHITVILKVLGVTNRTAAVMEAVKQGYITKEDAYL